MKALYQKSIQLDSILALDFRHLIKLSANMHELSANMHELSANMQELSANMSKIVCKCRIFLELQTPAFLGFCKPSVKYNNCQKYQGSISKGPLGNSESQSKLLKNFKNYFNPSLVRNFSVFCSKIFILNLSPNM